MHVPGVGTEQQQLRLAGGCRHMGGILQRVVPESVERVPGKAVGDVEGWFGESGGMMDVVGGGGSGSIEEERCE